MSDDTKQPEESKEATESTSEQPEEKPDPVNRLRGQQMVEQRIVNASCRRDSDQGGPCGGSRALITVNPRNKHTVFYKCESCGGSWSVPVGGGINI